MYKILWNVDIIWAALIFFKRNQMDIQEFYNYQNENDNEARETHGSELVVLLA